MHFQRGGESHKNQSNQSFLVEEGVGLPGVIFKTLNLGPCQSAPVPDGTWGFKSFDEMHFQSGAGVTNINQTATSHFSWQGNTASRYFFLNLKLQKEHIIVC